jgi:hypothetical protein
MAGRFIQAKNKSLKKSMSIPLPIGNCEAIRDLHTVKIMSENSKKDKGIFSNALFENIPCLYNSLLSKL